MKVLVFLANGFELMEFSPFIDIIGWTRTSFSHKIDVITCGFHQQVNSAFHVPVTVDQLIDSIAVKDYAALSKSDGLLRNNTNS